MVLVAGGSNAPLSKLSTSVLFFTLKYQELMFTNYNNFIHVLYNSTQGQPLSNLSLTELKGHLIFALMSRSTEVFSCD